ncbi:MAG: TerB family tellurite resistance protein [Polyangiaceae bacterium]
MAGMPTPPDAEFAFELVKLLLQIAWADEDVAPAEADALLSYARRSNLDEGQLDLLRACLAGHAPLPPPNLGFLKDRRLDVMRAVKGLLTSDLHVAEEEKTILEQLSSLLR